MAQQAVSSIEPAPAPDPAPAPGVPAARPLRGPAAWVGRPVFWAVVLLVGFAVPVASRMLRPPAPPLPVLGSLAPFELVAQDGRPFGSEQLRGKVWLAGFIFTRCPTICPAVTATMAKIQKRARGLTGEFLLVSFSVDPRFDTPAVLADYAARHAASPRMWKFVTGELDAIERAVTGGLKIAMAAPEGEQDFASVMHGTHFVLVDRELRLRGFYDSARPEVVDEVLADAAMLINRGD